jgi:hypothetical protein
MKPKNFRGAWAFFLVFRFRERLLLAAAAAPLASRVGGANLRQIAAAVGKAILSQL